jgi:ABC-type amino acid transport system permease subunit
METAGHFFMEVARLLKRGGIWWGVVISLSAAVLSFAVAVAIVVSWAPDRFNRAGPAQVGQERPILIRVLGLVAKNLAGVVLVLLGLIMAIPGVPGQGLLTAVIGITLLNFPGKLRLERRCLQIAALRRGINRLRARWGRPPLEMD